MFKLFIFLILYAPSLLFASVQSLDHSGSVNASEVIDKSGFQAIGETTFTVLFWDIYKSKLLTTTGTYPVNNNKGQLIYEINYLADISSDDLIEKTEEQWQHIGLTKDHYQSFIPMLRGIWPDISKGDTLALLIKDGVSIFYYNDKKVGSINSPIFGPMFIDIWLAEKTSQPSLRHELLGRNADEIQ